MKIINKTFVFQDAPKESWLSFITAQLKDVLDENQYILRFAIVEVEQDNIKLEATLLEWEQGHHYAPLFAEQDLYNVRKKDHQAEPFAVVQIVPTGILCDIGGFAGDACPVTNLLSSVVDTLITHPNAVNASEINEKADKILYVEGKSLDDFLLGRIGLLPSKKNVIGTFIDPSGHHHIEIITHILNAARMSAGIDCHLYTILKEALGVEVTWTPSGCAVGTLLKPEAILDSTQRLLDAGATAIGGLSLIEGVSKEMYQQHMLSNLPNPSGGIEAIISHLISKAFRIPTAHAPLPYHDYHYLKEQATIDPRGAAELISTTNYFCVLKGLHKAPLLKEISSLQDVPINHLLTLNNVGAIICPASALGGIPALAAEYNNIPLIAVKENTTILQVTNDKLKMPNIISVENYLEAVGVITALKEGISLKNMSRPILDLKEI